MTAAAIDFLHQRMAAAPDRVRAYASHAPSRALEPWAYETGPLGCREVELEVTHCGVCHTDVHLIDNDFGLSTYPPVPGHEAVGAITAVGRAVRGLAVGHRVGVGWQRGVCNECERCRQGFENLCTSPQPTALAGYGGFAHSLRVDYRFAIPIPDTLPSAMAAPLLCGGITVYSALGRLVRPASRVGVIGIGGLGHLAVQFARAMGAEVFAFSTRLDRAKEARHLQAGLDVLLSADVNLDWNAWLSVLRPNGGFCQLGAAPGPVTLPSLPMIVGQFTFAGSVIGSPRQMAEMLRFAALHDVRPAIEVLPMSQVNLALDKLRRNQVRYSMVLAAETEMRQPVLRRVS